uniref:Putative secreted protein n=1 Tax=Amblyomma parvum TaxID=251391 RepID=A0A023G2X4_AMBPA
MANTTLVSSVLLLFSVFSLDICVSLTISTTEEKVGDTMEEQVPKVGDPCDGNEDCGPGKCCVRLFPENGTVCQNLSVAKAPCSETRLKEHTTTALPPLPSCRADEEAQAKPNYTHPYDKYCPCEMRRDHRPYVRRRGCGGRRGSAWRRRLHPPETHPRYGTQQVRHVSQGNDFPLRPQQRSIHWQAVRISGRTGRTTPT